MIAFKNYCTLGNARSWCRHMSSTSKIKSANLKGRDIISPLDLTVNDVKCILWTANEIKTGKRPSNLLHSRHVTFINATPIARNQISCERAVQALGGHFSIFERNDWEIIPNLTDYGRLFSSLTDLVVINGLTQTETMCFADGASIPVLGARTDLFAIVKTLADLMTLLEVLGPLRRKSLAWVGPVTPIAETYLCLGPKVGLKFRLHCFCPHGSGMMSPKLLPEAHSLCNSEIHDCTSPEEAVYRADIVATSPHNDARKRITLKLLEEASFEWRFLHSLPRSNNEVSDDVFRHKSNLTWESSKNTVFIYMALLERMLTDQTLTSPMPDFDGPP